MKQFIPVLEEEVAINETLLEDSELDEDAIECYQALIDRAKEVIENIKSNDGIMCTLSRDDVEFIVETCKVQLEG